MNMYKILHLTSIIAAKYIYILIVRKLRKTIILQPFYFFYMSL